MAGYFRKLNGHVYDGAHVAGEELTNGTFVQVDAATHNVILLAAADTGTVFRCQEKDELWGLPALVLDCVSSSGKTFMVENDFDADQGAEYDETLHTVKVGELVKMRIPLPGDQIVLSVDSDTYAAAKEDALFTPGSKGAIAAKA